MKRDKANKQGQKPVVAAAPVNDVQVQNPAEQPAGNGNEQPEAAEEPKGEQLPVVQKAADAVIAVADVVAAPVKSTFTLQIGQKNDEGEETIAYGIKFTLDTELGNKPDYIIGTALQRLFEKMDMAKAFKTKLFDSRKPLHVSIKSDTVTLDFGVVEEVFLQKMKLNNGERAKLAFVDRCVVISNAMLAPITTVRATELREDLKGAAQLRYGKPAKGLATASSIVNLSRSEIKVTEKGEEQLVLAD